MPAKINEMMSAAETWLHRSLFDIGFDYMELTTSVRTRCIDSFFWEAFDRRKHHHVQDLVQASLGKLMVCFNSVMLS